MKLGVSYNVFDGTEHLYDSIISIMDYVDSISIVYQSISNTGNKASIFDINNIENLNELGIVDSWVEYNYDSNIPASHNELNKRNRGLEFSKANGCTHHISIDCDEMYDTEQFKQAKEIAEKYDSTYCQMQTYYGDINHKFKTPEEYYVPFIYKINNRRFEFIRKYPVTVDPTRKMKPQSTYIFQREQLEMHHYSWIRNDMRSKLVNSSAFKNRTPEQIEQIIEWYNNWKPGMNGLTHSGLIELCEKY